MSLKVEVSYIDNDCKSDLDVLDGITVSPATQQKQHDKFDAASGWRMYLKKCEKKKYFSAMKQTNKLLLIPDAISFHALKSCQEQCYFNEGLRQYQYEKWECAMKCFQMSNLLNPGKLVCYYWMAHIQFEIGNNDQALLLALKAIEMDEACPYKDEEDDPTEPTKKIKELVYKKCMDLLSNKYN